MRGKRWLTLAVLLVLVLTLGTAALADEYTYTVRIYAGAQGTIDGGTVVEYTGMRYGERVNFSARNVELNDSGKYYVRGIRESGRDNNTVDGRSSFEVTGDIDYVVAYGILGDAVAYTVNYVDTDGNALAPSETFYGNVGDKPVVAYLYIDGYQPQAYNITQTLSENAADNVFNFVYMRIEALEAAQAAAQAAVVPAAAEAAAAGENAAEAAPGEEAAGEAAGEGANENGLISEEEFPAEPEEILDLDTPLAGPSLPGSDAGEAAAGEAETGGALDAGTIASFVAAGLAVIALAWVLVSRKKKKQTQE